MSIESFSVSLTRHLPLIGRVALLHSLMGLSHDSFVCVCPACAIGRQDQISARADAVFMAGTILSPPIVSFTSSENCSYTVALRNVKGCQALQR